jgi:hypothetical protein
VRKLIKIALIIFGIKMLLRWWRGRTTAAEPSTPAPPADDPADELRRKLAESREDAADEDSEPPAASVTDRRADVHAEGRAALDEMKSSDES